MQVHLLFTPNGALVTAAPLGPTQPLWWQHDWCCCCRPPGKRVHPHWGSCTICIQPDSAPCSLSVLKDHVDRAPVFVVCSPPGVAPVRVKFGPLPVRLAPAGGARVERLSFYINTRKAHQSGVADMLGITPKTGSSKKLIVDELPQGGYALHTPRPGVSLHPTAEAAGMVLEEL